MRKLLVLLLLACAIFGTLGPANAVTINVPASDPGGDWQGFMNVFELPSNGGGYAFGSGWGVNDLVTGWAGSTLSLAPNTVNDASPFWYVGGGAPGNPGNKIMEANYYKEVTGPLAGQAVTFQGKVLSNSLTSAHQAIVFVKDFAPDYSSSVDSFAFLTPGDFSVTLNTINDPARHVQYGFQVKGPNVWITDVGPFGSVQIGAVPEPASLAMGALGLMSLVGMRRRGR